jgi:hypothetical protein
MASSIEEQIVDQCIAAQIVRVVQHDRDIVVPEIARRLGLSPLDLAGILPDIIEREGWHRGRLNLCRAGGE